MFQGGKRAMIIPARDETQTAITVVFWKPVEKWTSKDRAVILQRLAAFMRKAADDRKRRRRKVAS
jgi:hypothetical protein